MIEKIQFIKLSACLHFTLLLKWTRLDQKEVFNADYRGTLIEKLLELFLKY